VADKKMTQLGGPQDPPYRPSFVILMLLRWTGFFWTIGAAAVHGLPERPNPWQDIPRGLVSWCHKPVVANRVAAARARPSQIRQLLRHLVQAVTASATVPIAGAQATAEWGRVKSPF